MKSTFAVLLWLASFAAAQAPDRMTLVVTLVRVAPNEGAAKVRAAVRDADLTVVVDPAGRNVVLRGPAEAVFKADALLRELDAPEYARLKTDVRLVRLNSREPQAVAALLREIYPKGLEIIERPKSMSLLLEGSPELVEEAAETARDLDGPQPRTPTAAGWVEMPAKDREVRVRLRRPLGPLPGEPMPLEKAIALLEEKTGVKIDVDWPAMGISSIKKSDVVSLPSRPVNLEHTLERVIDQLAGAPKPGWQGRPTTAVDNGRLAVSPLDAWQSRTKLVFYDVRDLIGNPLDEDTRVSRLVDIINQIRSIDPETFFDGAEAPGQVREHRSILIIRQTLPNHEKIVEYLAAMRRSLADAYDNPVRPGRSR